MESDEIGRREIWRIVRDSWRWSVVLAAVCGLAAFLWWSVVLTPSYSATASLLIRPALEGGEKEAGSAELWHSLARSGRVLDALLRRLVDEGMVEAGTILQLNGHLSSRVVLEGRGRSASSSPMLELTALGDTPEQASAIANAWAEVFLDQSQSMMPPASSEAEKVLGAQLSPTRKEIDELATEKAAALDEFQERKESTSTAWDRRISSTKSRAEKSLAEFRTETRRLMQEVVSDFEGGEGENARAIRSHLLELAAVRSQLAQTPRILTLEKAAGDEALAEVITEGLVADRLDSPLTTEQINPLYDQLALRALELESAIARIAGGDLSEVSRALAALDRIQLERAAALAALEETTSLELKLLRRQRSRALEDIAREETRFLQELERRVGQLADLEERLSTRHNAAVLARLIGEVEPVSLAAPAVPSRSPISRQVPAKVALAILLGGTLGLMVGLFRSSLG